MCVTLHLLSSQQHDCSSKTGKPKFSGRPFPCLYSSPIAGEKSVSDNQVTGEVSGARQFAGLSQGLSQSAA